MMRLQRDRAAFIAWWAEVGRLKRALALLVLLLMAAVVLFALAVMGPRLVREGRLLWFGTRADGAVLEAVFERSGTFKGGAPKYRLVLRYGFRTADGRPFTGTTVRNDIREPRGLETGDPMVVYYDPAFPGNSVADYNLRTDVYALALFLPFLTAIGLLVPAWFALGLLRSPNRRSGHLAGR